MPTGSFATPIQRQAVLFARAHPDLQQFGQAHSDQVWGGRTACTHTICQFLEWFVHGRRLTLNEVNHLAGMPTNARAPNGQPRGMRPNEVETFLRAVRLPYRVVRGRPFGEVREAARLGPVLYAMRYGSAPSWRGTVYGGIQARPPFAISGGRTQLNPAADVIRHAVLLLGERRVTDARGQLVALRTYRKEPNHGSPARAERPACDVIDGRYARAEYEAYKAKLHQELYAVIPTRKVK